MIKIFIIGASSNLAREFIMNNNLKNISIFGSYNKNNITKILKKKQFTDKNKKKFFKINLNRDMDLKKISKFLIKYEPDVIINFSSILTKRNKLKNVKYKDLIKVFSLNFFSHFKLYSKICAKLDKLRRKTLIINISSKVVLGGGYKIYEYSTSKAATANLLKCLHREFRYLRFVNFVIPTVKKKIKNKAISYKKYIDNLNLIITKNKKIQNFQTVIVK